MALKPDLNQTANLQNVVVYVSNDNFAQSYAVEPQNGSPQTSLPGYPHNMAPLAQTKNFSAAKQQHIFPQGGYFENVYPLSNIAYQNGANLKSEVVSKPDECDNRDRYPEPYVTILGSEVPGQSVRCDSVRSETAESSCSSLSSADDGVIVVQNPSPEMVVYDPSVSVRPGGGGLVLVAPPQTQGTAVISVNQPQFTTVPYGWKRLLNNGSVIYISPSNTALNSLDQVKEYLLTSGTCKCGLECHFKYDTVFNFDPKVIAKPWIMSPDTNTGDLTKLCNHKRKIMAMASLDYKPPDLDVAKMRKEFELKKKRRKIGLPMSSQSGISMSQILAQREKLALEQQQQAFNKEIVTNSQQGWPSKNPSTSHGHLQNVPDGQQQQNPLMRCHDSSSGGNRMMTISPVVVAEGVQTTSPPNASGPSIHIHSQQVVGPNGQIINLQDFPSQSQNQIIQGQNMFHAQPQQQQQQQHNRMFMNTQPVEPSGPGRPLKDPEMQHKMFVNQPQYELVDPCKSTNRQFGFNGVRTQQQQQHQPKFHWQHRMPSQQQMNQMMHMQQQQQQNVYERVPPLHQHTPPNPVWQEEMRRKKVKVNRLVKRQYHPALETCQIRGNQLPCPNIDVRQIPMESSNRQVVMGQMPQQHNQNSSSPSFMEDPSGYLAQQTALLNSTINRQTGNNNYPNYGEVPLPSNVVPKPTRINQQNMIKHKQIVDSSVVHLEQQQMLAQQHCQGCISDSNTYVHQHQQKIRQVRSGTPEDPVTSTMYTEKLLNQASPDTRPIQGGTVSTSNVSPIDSDPPTPNTPTPPQTQKIPTGFSIQNQEGQIVQIVAQSREEYMQQCHKMDYQSSQSKSIGVVTTMASGRTTGCNTITSVLAGRTNTATVSINAGNDKPPSNQGISINVSKSPLEMVQSVVSSIQVPHSQQPSTSQGSPHILKHSPTGLPPGHILVSSNGQLIMASAAPGHANVMAPPPPPKVVSSSMPPISVSPMVTNVTATMSQVIPAVAQQVLGQQTVLVNTLPTPFVIQPGVTMTMEGMTVGQNMQLPQIVTGNLIQQQLDGGEARRAPALLSPDTKKKGKKRKLPSQTVAGMLHIAAQQNSGGVVVNQQGFPQQIQMTHSPQGLTTTPVMQALTIVPSKTGGPPQIVMNGQTQQIITNSQPAQQINLLQPVGLINGTTGVVQNIPIQQFIVPNIGGSMVMNADGTATILQDTTNLGMQLQIQNVNGQNVLTPIQSNNVFNGGQNILATGPAGMVIRAPTSQGKIIQQQHSPGAQFLSPNGGQFVVNGAQFSGQLSPLVASVSPSQQVTFNTSPQHLRSNNQIQANQQEFIQVNGQMGQTLMVPCTPQVASSPSNQQQQQQQNTTFVQQNTTIVQQQTTMVANQQQLQNFQQHQNNHEQEQQNFLFTDKGQMHALIVQQQQHRNNHLQDDLHYRQSVSTQTAVNQNSQAVTCQTSTLSAGSPPDTTTLSPVAAVEQSPPAAADTTTHTGGSTDDGLSPAPSNCSVTCSEINVPGRPGSRTMAMVHCVSSSEPDLMETNHPQSEQQDWRKMSQTASSIKEEYIAMKEFTDVSSGQMTHYAKKQQQQQQQHYGHLVYEDTANMVSNIQFIDPKMKQDVLNAKHYGKLMHQKRTDVMLVMDSTLFGDEDNEADRETVKDSDQPRHEFKVGDLVWGPTKGSSSWPGKIVRITQDLAQVKWFGCEKNLSKIKVGQLQTLTEGFETHHQAGKKARTSRKLNIQLEKAIQEAMAELDQSGERPPEETQSKVKVSSSNTKKSTVRLRGGQR